MVDASTSVLPGSTDGSEEGKEPTAEQIKKMADDNRLASEAAKWRKSTRDAEARAKVLQDERDALAKQIEEGTATDREAVSEVAKLTREIAEFRNKDKARDERERALEAKTKANAIKSRLAEIVSEGKLLEPAAAIRLLTEFASIDADDTVVFNVKDPESKEATKVTATYDGIQKFGLLPGIFVPPAGKPGTGARGTQSAVGIVNGIDMERAKSDTGYYREHRAEIMAIRRARSAQ